MALIVSWTQLRKEYPCGYINRILENQKAQGTKTEINIISKDYGTTTKGIIYVSGISEREKEKEEKIKYLKQQLLIFFQVNVKPQITSKKLKEPQVE